MYVYELIDPINKRPFYIGKGSNKRRMYVHVEKTIRGKFNNLQLFKVIKNILNSNKRVIYKIVFRSENENEVFAKEIELIKHYGKRCKGGILTNITDGGEGRSQKIPYEMRQRISKKMVGRKLTEEHKQNLRISLKKSKKFKRAKKSSTYRLNMSRSLTGRKLSEQHISKIKEASKKQNLKQQSTFHCKKCGRSFKTVMSFGKHKKRRCSRESLKNRAKIIDLYKAGNSILKIKGMGYKSVRYIVKEAQVGKLVDPLL